MDRIVHNKVAVKKLCFSWHETYVYTCIIECYDENLGSSNNRHVVISWYELLHAFLKGVFV